MRTNRATVPPYLLLSLLLIISIFPTSTDRHSRSIEVEGLYPNQIGETPLQAETQGNATTLNSTLTTAATRIVLNATTTTMPANTTGIAKTTMVVNVTLTQTATSSINRTATSGGTTATNTTASILPAPPEVLFVGALAGILVISFIFIAIDSYQAKKSLAKK